MECCYTCHVNPKDAEIKLYQARIYTGYANSRETFEEKISLCTRCFLYWNKKSMNITEPFIMNECDFCGELFNVCGKHGNGETYGAPEFDTELATCELCYEEAIKFEENFVNEIGFSATDYYQAWKDYIEKENEFVETSEYDELDENERIEKVLNCINKNNRDIITKISLHPKTAFYGSFWRILNRLELFDFLRMKQHLKQIRAYFPKEQADNRPNFF